jgi:type I restriction enzyme S subunit
MTANGNPQWPRRKLGEFLTVLTDYHANGSYEKLKENVTLLDRPDYAVMIRTTNFEKNDFHEDLKFISEHAYNFLAKSKVLPGDILMNKIANAGSVYRVPDLRRPVSLAMNLFLLRTNQNELNQDFAFYYLKANEAYIKSFASGTAAKTITKEAVRNLEIRVPPILVQEKIANIFSAYDELIENSQRRIRILEVMTSVLYREWFVSFRFPGHERLPRSASPIGNIPQGWEVRKVSEFADFERGFEPGSEAYTRGPASGRIRFLRVGDLSKRNSDMFISTELAEGRILVPSDIAITLDGSVGSVRMGLSGAYSTGIRKLVVRDESRLGWSFAYHLLLSESIQATIQAHSKGTTIKHAGSAVAAFEFISPPASLIQLFEDITSPMLRQILCLECGIASIRKQIELLLPRLLSGRVNWEIN